MNTEPASTNQDTRWRATTRKLMLYMLAVLPAFFFIVTLIQLAILNRSILQTPGQSIAVSNYAAKTLSANPAEPAARLAVEAELESDVVSRRYHNASVLLMSRIWLIYLGFITGMVLAVVGASFILGEVKDRGGELNLGTGSYSGSLKTTYPGLILAALGIVLMTITLLPRGDIEVDDSNVYLQSSPVPVAPVPIDAGIAPPIKEK